MRARADRRNARLRAEREALELRRSTVVGQAVTELNHLADNLDTTLEEVGELLEKYTGHPEPAVRLAYATGAGMRVR